MTKKKSYFSAESAALSLASQETIKKFRLSSVKEEADSYGLEATFQNDVTGVKFEYSPGEGTGWRAIVGRLVDGKFPKHPIHIDRDTKFNRFDIRDIAALRISLIPEIADKIANMSPLSAVEICLILNRCCRDIFDGDFSSFAALRDRVLKRLN